MLGGGEQTRALLRPEDFRRMRIEGDDHGGAACFLRMPGRRRDDGLVAAMHSVKNADREEDRARHFG